MPASMLWVQLFLAASLPVLKVILLCSAGAVCAHKVGGIDWGVDERRTDPVLGEGGEWVGRRHYGSWIINSNLLAWYHVFMVLLHQKLHAVACSGLHVPWSPCLIG